jgi:hypothetical protein
MENIKIKPKKIIILEHNGGRFGNQLWNYINVLAYAYEKNLVCKNYSFFEYQKYFKYSSTHKIIDLLSLIMPGRIRLRIYKYLVNYIKKKKPTCLLNSGDLKPFYLEEDFGNYLCSTIYLNGWLFRCPTLIKKHYTKIKDRLRIKNKFVKKIDAKFLELNKTYQKIIGVHIRQGDYKFYMGGQFYIDQKEVLEIIKKYTEENSTSGKVLFFICSDSPIEKEMFSIQNLNVMFGTGVMIEDFYSLSKCHVVVGSDSTFGAVSAYYGNIPFVILNKENTNWSKIDSDEFEYYNGSYNLQL